MKYTEKFLQGVVLDEISLNILMNDLNEGIIFHAVNLPMTGNGGGRDSEHVENGIRIPNDLDKLERSSEKYRIKFNRDKCKVLGRNNHLHKYSMG